MSRREDERILRLQRSPLSRRTMLRGALGFSAAALLAACGGGDNDADSEQPTDAASPEPTSTSDEAGDNPDDALSPTEQITATEAEPANPTVSPTEAQETSTAIGTQTASDVRLFPLSPSELGAPEVPAATESTAENPTPYASIIDHYAEYGTDAAPGEFPRLVRHAFGETPLDTRPERVVVLDRPELESAVLLGVQPVGVMDGSFYPALQPAVDNAVNVGLAWEPDIEAIAALTPDLIQANATDIGQDLYDLLNEIAPTVFAYWTGVAWKHNFALSAQTLGREAEASQVIEEYENRVRMLNERLPLPRPTVTLIRVRSDHLRYMQRANFAGVLLDDLGFPRPPLHNVDDFGLNNMSLESLGEYAPAGLIVVTIDGGDENDFGNEVLESPLWQSLEAVQAGNVLLVDQSIWIAGNGYLAAHAAMDDIARHFEIE